MRKDFNIFVEGVADECFFKQYLRHVFSEEVPDERIVVLKGWDNLKTEASALRMHSMSANGGVNLVIVDAEEAGFDAHHYNPRQAIGGEEDVGDRFLHGDILVIEGNKGTVGAHYLDRSFGMAVSNPEVALGIVLQATDSRVVGTILKRGLKNAV